MTKFKKGDKVWYTGRGLDRERRAGTITEISKKDGRVTLTCELEIKPEIGSGYKWGYVDQFTAR